MIKVGDSVKFCNSIGIVRRLVCDNAGCIAMVQWMGRNTKNLQPFDIESIEPSNSVDCLLEIERIIRTSILEIDSSTEDKVVKSFISDILYALEDVFNEWSIDDYKADRTTEK